MISKKSFLASLREKIKRKLKGESDVTSSNEEFRPIDVYCDNETLMNYIIDAKPSESGLYLHEIIMISYSSFSSFKTVDTQFPSIFRYQLCVEEPNSLLESLILKNLRVREEPKYPAPLNEEEQHILQEILESKEQHIKMAFRTMLASGIRVGEAAKLIKQDIRLDNNRLILFIRKAKGGKSRTVPVINPEVALQLYEYAKEVPDGQPLFRVAKRTLQGHAERIKKNTGMNFYSHRARHTFATKLLAKDTRLDVIQRVMGHADISTTRKYAETLNQDILSIAEPINIDEDTDEDMKKESE